MTENILVVDDDPRTLKLLSKGLEKNIPDSRVLTAENGHVALDVLNGSDVCLVITDLVMPVMDGFELITQLMVRYPDIPVLVITGNPIPEAEQKRLTDSRLTVLSKPFTMQVLCGHVTTVLERHADGGVLHNISPSMFLQLVELEAKTCTIRIIDNAAGRQGVLFFANGRLLDARLADLQGEAAAIEIATWDTTSLVIQNRCPIKSARMGKSMSALLLDAARIKDERTDKNDPLLELAPDDLIDVDPLPADAPAAADDLIRRIVADTTVKSHLTEIGVAPQWAPLLAQLDALRDHFQIGRLQSVILGTGDPEDVIVLPSEPPVVVKVDSRYPKDNVLALAENR